MIKRQRKNGGAATLATVLVSLSLVAAAPGGAAESILDVPGVIEIGTIDPSSSSSGGSGGSNTGTGPTGSESETSTCAIPVWNGCLFWLEEEERDESQHTSNGSWYYYDEERDDRSGYYVNLLGGVFFTRVDSGDVSEGSGSGMTQEAVDRDYSWYANNLGYSEEHLDETLYNAEAAEESASEVSRLTAEAVLDAPVAGGNIGLVRDQDGSASSSSGSSSSGSNLTQDNYFGIPLYENGDQQAQAASAETQEFWNRTTLDGNIYLVNPVDNDRIEIVGLRLDQGDAEGSGSSSSSSESGSHTSIFGFRVIEQGESNEETNEYAFFNEWLHLTVDLVEGTVTGELAYDRGEESSSGSSNEEQHTNILGIPLWAEEHYEEFESESEWRDLSFGLDALQGVIELELGAWDESSSSRRTFENAYSAVGIEFGEEGTEESSLHTDGVSLGLNVGGGVLWIGAGYENRTESSSSVTDYTLGGNPLAGTSSESDESTRRIGVGAGSDALGTSAGAFYENSSVHEEDMLRVGGDDFLGVSHDDEHTEWGAGANAADGLFVFHMLYENGNSRDAVHVAGFPLGYTDEYQSLGLGVGGVVPNPGGSGNVLVYGFEHTEEAHDYGVFAGEDEIGHAYSNTTSDRLNVIVLDGIASLDAGREFTNTAVLAGEENEIGDFSGQSADGEAHAGPASARATLWFGYADFGDAVAAGALLATWCVDPGVPVPYNDVANAIPDATARSVVMTAVGLAGLVTCGLPAFAPVPFFLLSPCILVPVAHGLGFATAGAATGLVPVAGGTLGGAVDLAGSSSWDAYDASRDVTDGCVWLTIPDEVRNPQPVLWALDPANDASNAALEQAWPRYDGARLTAYSVVDMLFDAGNLVENPDGIPSPDDAAAMLPPPPVAVPTLPERP